MVPITNRLKGSIFEYVPMWSPRANFDLVNVGNMKLEQRYDQVQCPSLLWRIHFYLSYQSEEP